MTHEKKIWLCEQYAQKAWALSLALAQEAARAGQYGKGYAFVAQETRTLSGKLFEYAARARFSAADEDSFKGIVDFAFQTGLLSVNAMIEILHVEAADDKISNKSIAVCAEDIRNLAMELNELAENRVWQKPFVLPEITAPIRSSRKTDFFFRFSIGGVALVENALNVKEVCCPRKADITGGIFRLRGHEMRIIDCSERLNLPCTSLDPDRQTIMIIRPDSEQRHDCKVGDYAVFVDDLDVNTIFCSRIALCALPRADGIFSGFVRECWDVVGGEQLLFIDWQKLITV